MDSGKKRRLVELSPSSCSNRHAGLGVARQLSGTEVAMYGFLGADTGRFLLAFHKVIPLILINHTRLDVVVPLLIQRVLNKLPGFTVQYWTQYFNPVIQIACHKVRRTNQIPGITPVMKDEYARVLEIAIDDTDTLNVIGDTFDPGQ